MKVYIYVLSALLCASVAHARPVSYPGGATLMTMNDAEKYSLHLHYSPSAKYSVGYKSEYWRDNEWWLNGVQVNYLVKRWNKRNSQANLYVKGIAGVAHSDHGRLENETDLAISAEVAADWETRRWFTSYSARAVEAGDIDDFVMQSARVGVAPYIGDYGDLHTWLMLQVDHHPEAQHDVTVTPLVRFFYDVHLLEAGMNTRGDAMLNYVIRF